MKTDAKGKVKKGPKLTVDLPVEIQKKSFALRASTLKTLADYAAFLSAHHMKTIDEDRVVEGLIGGLERDRAFAAWQKENHHV